MKFHKKSAVVTGLIIFSLVSVLTAMRITSTRIAYVNIEKVFEELSEIKKARQELQRTLEERKEKVARMEEELESIQTRVIEQEEVVLPEDREEFEKMLETKKEELKNLKEESREFVVSREEDLLLKIMGDIYDAVGEIAHVDDYTVILDRDSVIYSEDDISDITEEVIKYLNEK
ncbi:MAG: OmpH family outer membrane protein [Elusimicrobiota bacterium]|nr:OmpH family outer membrane protein [Elusimicrobiota bacterium]